MTRHKRDLRVEKLPSQEDLWACWPSQLASPAHFLGAGGCCCFPLGLLILNPSTVLPGYFGSGDQPRKTEMIQESLCSARTGHISAQRFTYFAGRGEVRGWLHLSWGSSACCSACEHCELARSVRQGSKGHTFCGSQQKSQGCRTKIKAHKKPEDWGSRTIPWVSLGLREGIKPGWYKDTTNFQGP